MGDTPGRGAPQALGVPGTVLGVLPDVAVADRRAALDPGDRIVLYTDGVTEARCDSGFFGEERLARVLASARGSAGETAAALLDEVVRFQAGHPRDDIAIVALAVP